MVYRRYTNIILRILLAFLLFGCSSRMDSPVINSEDGTTIYNSRDNTGINADVILYKGIDEGTGLPLTAGSFMLGEKARVYADVKLLNRNNHPDESLMFHLDWIDLQGNSIFKKRVDIPPGDTLTKLKSAISVEPGKRDTGNYKFRVYLFRELIAEKNFSLTSYNVDSANIFSQHNSGRIAAEISTGSKYDKKKDIPADTGSIFTLGEKAKIYAGIQILNGNLYKGKELVVDIDWTDSNDSSFFKKTIRFSPYDKLNPIRSTISISDKSREPGKYKIRVYLYGNLIKEKPFLLVKEKKQIVKLQPVKGIETSITYCSRFNKRTMEAKEVSDSFMLKNKSRVYALVNLKDSREVTDTNSKIKIEWINPEDKEFYKKNFKLTKNNRETIFPSAISISPGKRTPGKYKCRVFYNSSLICEKSFTLISSPK